MFPTGTHRARPIDCALGMTGTNKEQIGVMFELVDDPSQRITWYGFFTDATFERTIESLRHLGWHGNEISDFHGGLPEGVSNEVDIVVEEEANQQGELRLKVRWINSGGGVAVKTVLDDQQVRAFSARMKARVAGLQAKAGAAPAPRTPTPAAVGAAARGPERTIDPSVDDNDIPF
jgi:hypothetical protein